MIKLWLLAFENRSFRWASGFLFFVGFIALFSPFIANELPLIVSDQQGIHFPIIHDLLQNDSGLSSSYDLKSNNDKFILYPPITWSPGKSDYVNSNYKSPFETQNILNSDNKEVPLPWRKRHWLGTDLRGSDVLAGIISGAGISLRIGFFAALFSLILGLIIGGMAGWLKDYGLQLSIGVCLMLSIYLIFVIQLCLLPSEYFKMKFIYLFVISFLFFVIAIKFGKSLSGFHVFSRKIKFPLDGFVLRLIEIFSSFPKIVLILVLAGYFKASVELVIILLVLTGWPDFTRIIRAEFIRISKFNYIEAAHQIGSSDNRVIVRHILPNAIVPIMVAFVYAIATNMLVEAGLSFLGLGVPPTTVTWGSIMASGKENLDAWWLVIFPGIMLTLTIACIHKVAEGLQKELVK